MPYIIPQSNLRSHIISMSEFIIICHCRVSWITQIYVAVPREYIEMMHILAMELNGEKLCFIEGGTTRHHSIYNGLKEAEAGKRVLHTYDRCVCQ